MNKKLAVLPFIGLLSVSSASGELEISTGFGHQYGGVLGVQFANNTQLSKYYSSTGLLGALTGLQHL